MRAARPRPRATRASSSGATTATGTASRCWATPPRCSTRTACRSRSSTLPRHHLDPAADESKTLFLATASHELKTPLTVIRGFAQMLQLDGSTRTSGQHAMVAIETRADQLAGIVDRLLMSSRIDAGRIDLDLDLIDLEPIVRERAHALEGATGRLVVIDIGTGLPAVLRRPRRRHHGHRPPARQRREVLARRWLAGAVGPPDPRASGVVVAVADRGIGMTPEQVERCFERFWQAESSDVRRFAGSGIGLYIVRSLVEGMGGTTSVASEVGEWTVFSFTPPHLGAVAELPTSARASRPRTPTSGRPR